MSENGWIGVDFDGTLAEYHGWSGWNVFGKPIPLMVERVKKWIDEGQEVRIMTARISRNLTMTHTCRVTGTSYTGYHMSDEIMKWCQQHVGKSLPVTCVKDYAMIELWDDRAIQVVPNTGRTLAEEHMVEMTALRGKAFKS